MQSAFSTGVYSKVQSKDRAVDANLPAWGHHSVSPELRRRFLDEVTTPANLKRMFWVITCFLPLSLLYLVNNIVYTGEADLIAWGIIDVVCSIIFMLLCYLCMKRKAFQPLGHRVVVSYYAFCLAAAMIYYFLGYTTAGENVIYAIGMVLPAVLFHIPSRQAIAMLIGGQVVYTICLSLTEHPFQALLGAWITAAYGLGVACLAVYFLFSREWKNFLQLQIIQQNNAELKKLNAKLEEQQEEMNHIMALTAHDLRSPALNLKGLFDVLLTKAEWSKAPYDEVLKLSRESLSGLVKLLDSLLNSYRTEQDLYETRRENIDLVVLLNELLNKHTTTKHPVVLQTDENVATLSTDPAALRQVVDNLLSNAVKFSPRGAPILLTLHRTSDFWLIEVLDEGPGIPDDEQDRLFHKFFRASTITHSQQGAGLGLFIVSQLIKSLNGSVQYAARHPQGSVFKIQLPLNERDSL